MRFDRSMLKLYAVTDRSWVGRQSFYEQVEEALRSGITMLQLREKDLTQAEFLKEAKEVKKLAGRYGVPLIINDHVAVALECGADGIHVGQTDRNAADVRALIGDDMILGVTAKTVEQARKAQECGADYLGAGTVFGSSTKPDAACITYSRLYEICKSVSIPVAAIGGISLERISELKGSGIAGVAVVSAIFAEPEIGKAVRELLKTLERG